MEINENKDGNRIFIDPDKLLDKSNTLKTHLDIICSLCKGILSSPIELFCEHIFCSQCLNSWTEKLNDKCPTCNKVIYKRPQVSPDKKNILKILKFSDNNKIYTYNEYINYLIGKKNRDLNAGPLINSENKKKRKIKCNVCGTEYDNEIKEIENKYEGRNRQLTEELKKIYQYKRKLQGEIYLNKNNQVMPESTLIDKCKHFFGNYKPIFDCCNTAYGCYICHDENECHEYQISKKVICLLCACIYEGNACPNCKIKQCYQKKEN